MRPVGFLHIPGVPNVQNTIPQTALQLVHVTYESRDCRIDVNPVSAHCARIIIEPWDSNALPFPLILDLGADQLRKLVAQGQKTLQRMQ